MNPPEFNELARQLTADELSMSDVSRCAALLGRLNALRSWVESCSLAVTRRLNELADQNPGMFPEQIVADATRVTLNQALEPFRRSNAVELLPEFNDALGSGAVNVDHLDVLSKNVAGLDEPTRARLAERGAFLTEVASHTTSAEFGRTLRTEIRRAQADDGIATLERQRRNTRLLTWIDRTTGMWCLRGEFDPESGAILSKRLHDTVEALFHDAAPDTAPSDPLERQSHLRALALMSLTSGKRSGRSGGVDMSILVDAKTLVDGIHDGSVIDCGLPIELPVETIRRMACVAHVTPIIVGGDGVRLLLGRSTRLATMDQRKALRAMYRGCAVPGCCAAWDSVVIHHLQYYHRGGKTDIENLLPLCSKHHHLAHEGGWKFALDRFRNLTITLRDGTVKCHGPPSALAA